MIIIQHYQTVPSYCTGSIFICQQKNNGDKINICLFPIFFIKINLGNAANLAHVFTILCPVW
ncbi:MAG: hypothetical protein D3921_11900 [Candidatus Electrothrix sp. AW1]|nr:hypothetical protein [Candidatus Electrothrix gigas]